MAKFVVVSLLNYGKFSEFAAFRQAPGGSYAVFRNSKNSAK